MSELTPLARLMAQREITQTALAKALGVSRQAVQRWQAGETISTVNLRALSGFLRVSPAFLLGEETEVDDAGASPTGIVRRICELDVGPNGKRSVVKQLLVETEWLSSICPTAHLEALAVYSVHTDAMTPTLNPGDLVLVDTQDKNADDGLFVVSLDNGPCIRRLQRLPGRQVRIICDNPHYERLTVNSASGALRVLGRVAHCWAGRK